MLSRDLRHQKESDIGAALARTKPFATTGDGGVDKSVAGRGDMVVDPRCQEGSAAVEATVAAEPATWRTPTRDKQLGHGRRRLPRVPALSFDQSGRAAAFGSSQ